MDLVLCRLEEKLCYHQIIIKVLCKPYDLYKCKIICIILFMQTFFIVNEQQCEFYVISHVRCPSCKIEELLIFITGIKESL